MKIFWYIFPFLLALVACVEPYEPEATEYDSTLVVDGLITNEASPFTIRLTQSFPYSETVGVPIEQAQVTIEEENGGRTLLAETAAGVYQNNPAIFQGQIGTSYRLLITLADGKRFESGWELMKAAPEIERLHFAMEERATSDPDGKVKIGPQIYLNTKGVENKTLYYRWEYVETYEFRLLHPPGIKVEFGEGLGGGDDEILSIPFNEFEGNKCWKTAFSTNLLIATSENLSQDVIKDFPLLFIDNSSSRLHTRYSILVKQYAINQDYYEYLKKLEGINETTGSLFDPIPNEIFGNIKSVDGQDIPVLGYFSAAGASEKRLFINRTELPLGLDIPFGPRCFNDTIQEEFQPLYSKTRSGNLVLYDYHLSLFGDILGYLLTEPPCTSCIANEATNVKPDFW